MAFSTAISGINAAQSDLNVISNNIANSSTVGFKVSRAQFAEIYANSLLGSGSGNAGQGVELTEIRTAFSQGNIEFTNNGLDLAISGNGFFVISNDGTAEYTRAGSFRVDREGFVINESGGRLKGYQVAQSGEITGELGDLFIGPTLINPQFTSNVSLISNLDSRDTPPAGPFDPTDPSTYNSTTSTTVFDELGNSHVLQLFYVKSAPNSWNIYSTVDGGTPSAASPITFNSDGSIATGGTVSVTVSAADLGSGASDLTFDVDSTATTQFGTDFAVSSIVQDGFGAGQLISFDFDESGIAFARYFGAVVLRTPGDGIDFATCWGGHRPSWPDDHADPDSPVDQSDLGGCGGRAISDLGSQPQAADDQTRS